jgi:glycosyltransferase involved in cell wall biosynthesis
VRVLFLTKYTAAGPSSRYRVVQFLPFLDRAGIECDLRPLLDERYLTARFSGRSAGGMYLLRRALDRLRVVTRARRYDVVFIQKELFPWAPPVIEWALERAGARVVLDIDDAIHVRYAGHPVLANKVAQTIARATVVLAGNRYLTEYARRFNPQAVWFPTVVDAARFSPAGAAHGGSPVVGWMGTPETARYLGPIVPALADAHARRAFTFRVIGAAVPVTPALRGEGLPWSFEGEADALRGFDVGIMPLATDEWSLGKCSLKLLQYMSTGLATVSSPVGSVHDIIRDDDNGLLAATPHEWEAAVAALVADPERRARLGRRAREWVEGNYALDNYGPRMVEILRAVAEGRRVDGV